MRTFKADVPVRIRQKDNGVWVAESAMVPGLLVVSTDRKKLVVELVPQALADLAAAAALDLPEPVNT